MGGGGEGGWWGRLRITQKTRQIESFSFQYWASVVDGGPRLNQELLNVSCFLGKECIGTFHFRFFWEGVSSHLNCTRTHVHTPCADAMGWGGGGVGASQRDILFTKNFQISKIYQKNPKLPLPFSIDPGSATTFIVI